MQANYECVITDALFGENDGGNGSVTVFVAPATDTVQCAHDRLRTAWHLTTSGVPCNYIDALGLDHCDTGLVVAPVTNAVTQAQTHMVLAVNPKLLCAGPDASIDRVDVTVERALRPEVVRTDAFELTVTAAAAWAGQLSAPAKQRVQRRIEALKSSAVAVSATETKVEIISTSMYIETRTATSSDIRVINDGNPEFKCMYLNPLYFGALYAGEDLDVLQFSFSQTELRSIISSASHVVIAVVGNGIPTNAHFFNPWEHGHVLSTFAPLLLNSLVACGEGVAWSDDSVVATNIGSLPLQFLPDSSGVDIVDASHAFVLDAAMLAELNTLVGNYHRNASSAILLELTCYSNLSATLTATFSPCNDGNESCPSLTTLTLDFAQSETVSCDQQILSAFQSFQAKQGAAVMSLTPVITYTATPSTTRTTHRDEVCDVYRGAIASEHFFIFRDQQRKTMTLFCKLRPTTDHRCPGDLVELVVGGSDDAASLWFRRMSTMFAA